VEKWLSANIKKNGIRLYYFFCPFAKYSVNTDVRCDTKSSAKYKSMASKEMHHLIRPHYTSLR